MGKGRREEEWGGVGGEGDGKGRERGTREENNSIRAKGPGEKGVMEREWVRGQGRKRVTEWVREWRRGEGR